MEIPAPGLGALFPCMLSLVPLAAESSPGGPEEAQAKPSQQFQVPEKLQDNGKPGNGGIHSAFCICLPVYLLPSPGPVGSAPSPAVSWVAPVLGDSPGPHEPGVGIKGGVRPLSACPLEAACGLPYLL